MTDFLLIWKDYVLWGIGGIVSAVIAILAWARRLRKRSEKNTTRIEALETLVPEIRECMSNINNRLDEFEKDNNAQHKEIEGRMSSVEAKLDVIVKLLEK